MRKENVIPEELLLRGIYLEPYVGAAEYAWYYDDVLPVIEYLLSHGYEILGGDVYSIRENNIEITYDNWYFTNKGYSDANERAAAKAKKYIENYYKNNGNDFIYVLVYR